MSSAAALAIHSYAEAACDAAAAGAALQRLAQACDATMVTLVRRDSDAVTLTCSCDAQPAIDAYLHRRDMPDSRERRVNPDIAAGFRTDFDDFTPHEIARDAYYQDFLAAHGVRWHAAAALAHDGAGSTVISIKRSSALGGFERADIAAFDALLPALRAIERQARLLARHRAASELAACERLQRGAAVVDRHGHLLDSNPLLVFGDGLQLERRRLRAARADDAACLDAAIAAASLHWPAALPPVVVRRPSGRRPYLLDVVALTPVAAPARLLVVVNDLDPVRVPSARTLQRIFALTPRESELALRLAAGDTLRDAARALAISEAHARQRLKQVLAKTGCARQSALLAVLARL